MKINRCLIATALHAVAGVKSAAGQPKLTLYAAGLVAGQRDSQHPYTSASADTCKSQRIQPSFSLSVGC
jgi:hypothetical protein